MVHSAVDGNHCPPENQNQTQALRKLRDTANLLQISAFKTKNKSNIKQLSTSCLKMCSMNVTPNEFNNNDAFSLLEAATELMYLSLGQYRVVTNELLSRWEYIITQIIMLNEKYDENFQTTAELKSLLVLSSIKLEENQATIDTLESSYDNLENDYIKCLHMLGSPTFTSTIINNAPKSSQLNTNINHDSTLPTNSTALNSYIVQSSNGIVTDESTRGTRERIATTDTIMSEILQPLNNNNNNNNNNSNKSTSSNSKTSNMIFNVSPNLNSSSYFVASMCPITLIVSIEGQGQGQLQGQGDESETSVPITFSIDSDPLEVAHSFITRHQLLADYFEPLIDIINYTQHQVRFHEYKSKLTHLTHNLDNKEYEMERDNDDTNTALPRSRDYSCNPTSLAKLKFSDSDIEQQLQVEQDLHTNRTEYYNIYDDSSNSSSSSSKSRTPRMSMSTKRLSMSAPLVITSMSGSDVSFDYERGKTISRHSSLPTLLHHSSFPSSSSSSSSASNSNHHHHATTHSGDATAATITATATAAVIAAKTMSKSVSYNTLPPRPVQTSEIEESVRNVAPTLPHSTNGMRRSTVPADSSNDRGGGSGVQGVDHRRRHDNDNDVSAMDIDSSSVSDDSLCDDAYNESSKYPQFEVTNRDDNDNNDANGDEDSDSGSSSVATTAFTATPHPSEKLRVPLCDSTESGVVITPRTGRAQQPVHIHVHMHSAASAFASTEESNKSVHTHQQQQQPRQPQLQQQPQRQSFVPNYDVSELSPRFVSQQDLKQRMQVDDRTNATTTAAAAAAAAASIESMTHTNSSVYSSSSSSSNNSSVVNNDSNGDGLMTSRSNVSPTRGTRNPFRSASDKQSAAAAMRPRDETTTTTPTSSSNGSSSSSGSLIITPQSAVTASFLSPKTRVARLSAKTGELTQEMIRLRDVLRNDVVQNLHSVRASLQSVYYDRDRDGDRVSNSDSGSDDDSVDMAAGQRGGDYERQQATESVHEYSDGDGDGESEEGEVSPQSSRSQHNSGRATNDISHEYIADTDTSTTATLPCDSVRSHWNQPLQQERVPPATRATQENNQLAITTHNNNYNTTVSANVLPGKFVDDTSKVVQFTASTASMSTATASNMYHTHDPQGNSNSNSSTINSTISDMFRASSSLTSDAVTDTGTSTAFGSAGDSAFFRMNTSSSSRKYGFHPAATTRESMDTTTSSSSGSSSSSVFADDLVISARTTSSNGYSSSQSTARTEGTSPRAVAQRQQSRGHTGDTAAAVTAAVTQAVRKPIWLSQRKTFSEAMQDESNAGMQISAYTYAVSVFDNAALLIRANQLEDAMAQYEQALVMFESLPLPKKVLDCVREEVAHWRSVTGKLLLSRGSSFVSEPKSSGRSEEFDIVPSPKKRSHLITYLYENPNEST